MTQYYYLVASLPLLRFTDDPPFSSRVWLELCREQVSENDFALLARIAIDKLGPRRGDHALWQAYSAWETALRNELARQRAQRLGVDAEPFLRDSPFYCGMSALAKEALGAGTPRAVENALDLRRWSRLEELEAGTRFDLGRLIVYRLKLLLLERKNRFQSKPGRESFAQEYALILNNAVTWATAANSPLDYGEST